MCKLSRKLNIYYYNWEYARFHENIVIDSFINMRSESLLTYKRKNGPCQFFSPRWLSVVLKSLTKTTEILADFLGHNAKVLIFQCTYTTRPAKVGSHPCEILCSILLHFRNNMGIHTRILVWILIRIKTEYNIVS